MALKTQGTELFIKNNTGTEPVLLKFLCPTGITGLNSGGTDEIDISCLDDHVRRFALGMSDGGECSVPFIFDPEANSHRAAFDLMVLKDSTEACFACSDSETEPTLNTEGNIVAPVGRTSFIVPCLVKNIPIDIAGNEVVRGTLTLRVNGPTVLTFADGTAKVLG